MPVTTKTTSTLPLVKRVQMVRDFTQEICASLKTEDYLAQPAVEVSPPKWHLAHTTWFFENFLLVPFKINYKVYHPKYSFLFNSYYETVGERWKRTERGALTRPTVVEVYSYRKHVTEALIDFIENGNLTKEQEEIIELGLQHEQQHQELLVTDIKYILGINPLFPVYSNKKIPLSVKSELSFKDISSGVYEIGHEGDSFCFDNEKNQHHQYINTVQIAARPINNGEYLNFMTSGGYTNFNFWLQEGWQWVLDNNIVSPMHWHNINGKWFEFTLNGLREIDVNAPVAHVSFYEAEAYANWAKCRLPTEFEWEVFAKLGEGNGFSQSNFAESGIFHPMATSMYTSSGGAWEWTGSAYRPYTGFKIANGALGEYNGKFMVNQYVLRGGSCATSHSHYRTTYRNFFHPQLRWQFTTIRLAKDIV
ncbi:MAG: ergothioneine biosynthesis protein EgtB [Sphingobacteriales bacterium]|jgi:ergothioneine biosynthesis protein EgtB